MQYNNKDTNIDHDMLQKYIEYLLMVAQELPKEKK